MTFLLMSHAFFFLCMFQYLFVSLRNREGCYRLLRSVCSHLEDGSANSSPLFSSAENSFDQGKLVVSRSTFTHTHTLHLLWFLCVQLWLRVCVLLQNSSQSSLTDAYEELDGTDSGLLLQPPPTKLHTGGRKDRLTLYIRYIIINHIFL